MSQIPSLTVSVPDGAQDPTARTKVCTTTSSRTCLQQLVNYVLIQQCVYACS